MVAAPRALSGGFAIQLNRVESDLEMYSIIPRAQIDRRSLLRSALATGTLVGLDALFTAERTDAAAVGPNDNIKVTKIETFVLKNSWVFVKVSTDAGIVGWGEMLK